MVLEDVVVGVLFCGLEMVWCEGCFEVEGWCVCSDGSCFFVYVIIDVIYEDGELVGFVKVICDIMEWWCVSE